MAKNSNHISTRHFLISSRFSSRRFFFVACLLISLMTFAGCGGGKGNDNSNPPANVGGGFTLVASGGTLNDGLGANGLAVLVTLRDSSGNGPGAAGWQIKITGNGINTSPVSYDDGSQGSYITWWWSSLHPVSGTYTATATNGSTTLTYNFSIDATKAISQPILNKSSNIISWNTVTGAGSYYYELTDGSGVPVTSGYFASDSLVSQYSFSFPSLTDGSYLVSVYALTKDRLALSIDTASSPSLPSQENDSLATLDFIVNGSYALDARGGVLYEGLYSAGTATPTDYYGLVIWTSILTSPTSTASSPTPPAGDWNVTVTGPGLPPETDVNALKFKYPATYSQYVYWDYRALDPSGGPYTVTAVSSSGTATISQVFSIPTVTAQLSVATGLTVTPSKGGRADVSWAAVPGANSYYVNLWTDVNSKYTEISGNWMTSTSATIPTGTLTKGVAYDVYVTACQLNMTDTTTAPPAGPGTQVNMSDTVFSYATFTAQ